MHPRMHVFLLLPILLVLPLARADAHSTTSIFAADLEGWTLNSDGSISWLSSGGMPAGLLQATGMDQYLDCDAADLNEMFMQHPIADASRKQSPHYQAFISCSS